MKKCPKCDVELKEVEKLDLKLDDCPQCKGTFFDDDELRLAKDKAVEDANWLDFEIWKHEDKFEPKQSDFKCPKCSEQMISIEYGDTKVVVDYCLKCKGVWLDKGEFQKIIEELNSDINNKSFSEYIKKTVQEGKEIVTGHEGFLSEWRDFKKVLYLMQQRLFVENPRLQESMIKVYDTIPPFLK